MDQFIADIAPMIERLGLPATLLLLFVFIDVRRRRVEDARARETVERLQHLEDYQRDRLERLVVEGTTAQENLAEVVKESTATLRNIANVNQQLILAMRTRPCIQDTVDELMRVGMPDPRTPAVRKEGA